MDNITHTLLGVAALRSIPIESQKKVKKPIWLTAAAAANFPDLDVLIQSSQDPTLSYEYHRHFTHSFPFVPIASAICAGLFWLFFKKEVQFKTLFLVSNLAMATHVLLDACTSYGTLCFWPFTRERFALDWIAIIDPIYTASLALMFVKLISIKRETRARAALLLSTLYLFLGWIQNERALAQQDEIAKRRKHTVEYGRATPTLANLILWRSTYISHSRIFVDSIRIPIFGKPYVFEGGSVPLFTPDNKSSSLLHRNVKRFHWFADGFTSLVSPNQIGDLRYGIPPNSVSPLWGIGVDWERPDKPAERAHFRRESMDRFSLFWDQLFAHDVSKGASEKPLQSDLVPKAEAAQ